MELYDILGLEPSATPEDIKRAYKREALKHHPDKRSPEDRDQAEFHFKRVSEAYQILIDPHKRQEYDQYGTAGGGNGQPKPSSGTFRGFHDEAFFRFKSPSEIFEEFFGFRDPFDDPFFRNPFGSDTAKISPLTAFDNDPFFRTDPFFVSPMDQMNARRSSSTFFQSSSSSSMQRGEPSSRICSQSKSTKTTVRNGQRETVTEIRDSNGNVRVEVQTEMPDGKIYNRLFLNGQEQPSRALEDGKRYRINIS